MVAISEQPNLWVSQCRMRKDCFFRTTLNKLCNATSLWFLVACQIRLTSQIQQIYLKCFQVLIIMSSHRITWTTIKDMQHIHTYVQLKKSTALSSVQVSWREVNVVQWSCLMCWLRFKWRRMDIKWTVNSKSDDIENPSREEDGQILRKCRLYNITLTWPQIVKSQFICAYLYVRT